jgi:histone H3/H4
MDKIAQTTKTIQKKKKTRFFETYISKVLKQLSDTRGITANAKQQLNSALCIISKQISIRTINLTEIAKKKTISSKEVENSIKLIMSGDLLKYSIEEGKKSILKFQSEDIKGSSRQGKAGILFPPSISEKFLRNFGYSKIMVTSSAPVFLASTLEYITAEILSLAIERATTSKRIRITIRDLQLAIETDTEINKLFQTLNIKFLGGGVLPFIHNSLQTKKTRRKKKIQNTEIQNTEIKKTHRFRPGTVAIREIKKYQKMSNCLTFAKFPFERLVRSIISQSNSNMKISKDVFIILQYFIEQYIVNFLHKANLAAIHTGRVKLMASDIKFICSITKETYINTYIKEHTDIEIIDQSKNIYNERKNNLQNNDETHNQDEQDSKQETDNKTYDHNDHNDHDEDDHYDHYDDDEDDEEDEEEEDEEEEDDDDQHEGDEENEENEENDENYESQDDEDSVEEEDV